MNETRRLESMVFNYAYNAFIEELTVDPSRFPLKIKRYCEDLQERVDLGRLYQIVFLAQSVAQERLNAFKRKEIEGIQSVDAISDVIADIDAGLDELS